VFDPPIRLLPHRRDKDEDEDPSPSLVGVLLVPEDTHDDELGFESSRPRDESNGELGSIRPENGELGNGEGENNSRGLLSIVPDLAIIE
jgi:hypothetical protein